jgi:hypothetical protein
MKSIGNPRAFAIGCGSLANRTPPARIGEKQAQSRHDSCRFAKRQVVPRRAANLAKFVRKPVRRLRDGDQTLRNCWQLPAVR